VFLKHQVMPGRVQAPSKPPACEDGVGLDEGIRNRSSEQLVEESDRRASTWFYQTRTRKSWGADTHRNAGRRPNSATKTIVEMLRIIIIIVFMTLMSTRRCISISVVFA
jgi:hypothetical protein